MKSEVVKNWAVTILCSVTALVIVAGYFRLEKTLTLVEARSEALYDLAVTAEQRNRAAFDESVKVGSKLSQTLDQLNTGVLPELTTLARHGQSLTLSAATQLDSVGTSLSELARSTESSVQRLTDETSLGVALLNQSIGRTSESLQVVLQAADERIRDPRVDHTLAQTEETAAELRRGADHLTSSLAAIQASAESLQKAAAHAPAAAESVDKILRDQKKWSTWILLARLLSLAR